MTHEGFETHVPSL